MHENGIGKHGHTYNPVDRARWFRSIIAVDAFILLPTASLSLSSVSYFHALLLPPSLFIFRHIWLNMQKTNGNQSTLSIELATVRMTHDDANVLMERFTWAIKWLRQIWSRTVDELDAWNRYIGKLTKLRWTYICMYARDQTRIQENRLCKESVSWL